MGDSVFLYKIDFSKTIICVSSLPLEESVLAVRKSFNANPEAISTLKYIIKHTQNQGIWCVKQNGMWIKSMNYGINRR